MESNSNGNNLQIGTREMDTIKGQIKDILFIDNATNFAILKVQDETYHIIKAAGKITKPAVGANIHMKGHWFRHPRHGSQFKVLQSQIFVPDNNSGLAVYLGSGFARGVGHKIAHRIISFFGDETLNVLENEIWKLMLVPGIGDEKFKRMKDTWDACKKMHSRQEGDANKDKI